MTEEEKRDAAFLAALSRQGTACPYCQGTDFTVIFSEISDSGDGSVEGEVQCHTCGNHWNGTSDCLRAT